TLQLCSTDMLVKTRRQAAAVHYRDCLISRQTFQRNYTTERCLYNGSANRPQNRLSPALQNQNHSNVGFVVPITVIFLPSDSHVSSRKVFLVYKGALCLLRKNASHLP